MCMMDTRGWLEAIPIKHDTQLFVLLGNVQMIFIPRGSSLENA